MDLTSERGINGNWWGVVGPQITLAVWHQKLQRLASEDPLYQQVVTELTERFGGDEKRLDLWLIRRHDLFQERPGYMLGDEPQRFLDALAYDRQQPVDRIDQFAVASQYSGSLIEDFNFVDPEQNVDKVTRQKGRIHYMLSRVFGDDDEAECDWFHEVGIPLLDQKDYRACLRSLKALRKANTDHRRLERS